MKRRSLTVLLCLLAIISLASVGFASWVISAGDTEQATGSITVEKVEDQRLEIINVKINNENPTAASFVFGKSSSTPDFWLKNATVEDLDLELTFQVVYKGTDTLVKDAKIAIVLSAGDNVDFKNWIIVATDSATTAVFDESKSVYKCTLKLAWGSAWDGKNPFEYYKDKEVDGIVTGSETQTWGDHAQKQLSAMFGDLEKATFKVVITADPNDTAVAPQA